MHLTAAWAWSALVVALLANMAAYAFDLFDAVGWIDKALHAYTAFAVTLVLVRLLKTSAIARLEPYPLLSVAIVASLGLSLGVFWELGEWLFDLISKRNSIKGMTDTVLDLFFDFAGALVAAYVGIRPRG